MNIFQACDIRGIAGRELSDVMARKIALAVGTKLAGQKVVVGGDVRHSTPALQKIMINGLVESGCQVVDIGTVPTPVFYFALKAAGAAGGVMVTASHNPAPYNGFKFVLGDKPVTEAEVAEIGCLVAENARVFGTGSVERAPMIVRYISSVVNRSQRGSFYFKAVLDAGNGATSSIVLRLFSALGYRTIELFCEPDGSFPNRPPNPSLAENLTALCETVKEEQATIGIAFDGDGDRVAFVDELGRPVDNDYIIILLARHYLAQGPGTIIYDSKCSMVVPEEIKKAGGRPVMARAGHTFIRAAFLREKALFAGEVSGHFFFQELGNDDGMFAALKVCEYVTAHGSLAELVNSIPKYILTPDIRVPYHGSDKAEILDAAARALAVYQPNRIDGVRIEFPDGWGMIRSSVTEPLFTLRFEAKEEKRLREIAGILLDALPAVIQSAVRKAMPQ
ncbi:phosphoglucomutase and phosphomannomutase phosphoserine signature [Lucifera butyrica]|uniref:Phosphoglucomutase and phosphomannomutase phosphoserine signature n=1 Tax=Lucifera butyrica TaxID=1351585 RepID=A0A498R3F7_9FIRM|nr:phosphomannomutase/phosphoglucomutase [Lucifera butyrica]VBB05941.1 phosphoglucomutase and phosphomannomutase phosphoserine signature [Lucifera butyrica]